MNGCSNSELQFVCAFLCCNLVQARSNSSQRYLGPSGGAIASIFYQAQLGKFERRARHQRKQGVTSGELGDCFPPRSPTDNWS